MRIDNANLQGTASFEPSWTNGGTIQSVGLGATTTAPTIPTTTLANRIYYKSLGPKTYTVVGILEYTSNTGGAAGSGDYLFTLPAGLSWDTTVPFQALFTGNVGLSLSEIQTYTVPGSTSTGFDGSSATVGQMAGVIPYDATRYRIFLPIINVNFKCQASNFFGYNAASGRYRWQFTFQSL